MKSLFPWMDISEYNVLEQRPKEDEEKYQKLYSHGMVIPVTTQTRLYNISGKEKYVTEIGEEALAMAQQTVHMLGVVDYINRHCLSTNRLLNEFLAYDDEYFQGPEESGAVIDRIDCGEQNRLHFCNEPNLENMMNINCESRKIELNLTEEIELFLSLFSFRFV